MFYCSWRLWADLSTSWAFSAPPVSSTLWRNKERERKERRNREVNRSQENKLLKVENVFSNPWVCCTLIYLNIVILTFLKHTWTKKKAVQSWITGRGELRCGVTGEWSCPDDMPRLPLTFSSPGPREKPFEQHWAWWSDGELGKGPAPLAWQPTMGFDTSMWTLLDLTGIFRW